MSVYVYVHVYICTYTYFYVCLYKYVCLDRCFYFKINSVTVRFKTKTPVLTTAYKIGLNIKISISQYDNHPTQKFNLF